MEYDPQTREQIHQGRSKFASMAATYGLGVFNDSFFRESSILLALGAGLRHMQGWMMFVFALPYVLFAPWAGWLADRFPKRRVVIVAKWMELAAMLTGAVGICTLNWGFIFAMVFTMGLQSCLFSPALNGSIPELYPAVYVTKANAILKVTVTAMILAGISMAGVAQISEVESWGGIPLAQTSVAIAVVLIAAGGVFLSYGVPYRPAADPKAKFPVAGPWHTLREFARIKDDSLLAKVVSADVFVWFAGSMLFQFVRVMAIEQFGRGKPMAGYLVAAQTVGVAVGGIIGSRLAVGPRWHRILPIGLLAMAAPLLVMDCVPRWDDPNRLTASFVLLALAGVFGGMVLVPCEGFVQVRPAAHRKGAVLASVNFGIFFGILISGPLANLVGRLFVATRGLTLLGGLTACFGLWLLRALRKESG